MGSSNSAKGSIVGDLFGTVDPKENSNLNDDSISIKEQVTETTNISD